MKAFFCVPLLLLACRPSNNPTQTSALGTPEQVVIDTCGTYPAGSSYALASDLVTLEGSPTCLLFQGGGTSPTTLDCQGHTIHNANAPVIATSVVNDAWNLPPAGVTGSVIKVSGVSDFQLRNCTVDNSEAFLAYGDFFGGNLWRYMPEAFTVVNSTHITLENNTVVAGGASFSGVTDLRFAGNTFAPVTLYVQARDSSQLVFENNRYELFKLPTQGPPRWPLLYYNHLFHRVSGLTLKNNHMRITDLPNGLAQGFRIYDAFVIIGDSDGVTVADNDAANGFNAGVELISENRNILVSNNTFRDFGLAAIETSYAFAADGYRLSVRDSQFIGNTVSLTPGLFWFTWSGAPPNVTVTNNHFEGNRITDHIPPPPGGAPNPYPNRSGFFDYTMGLNGGVPLSMQISGNTFRDNDFSATPSDLGLGFGPVSAAYPDAWVDQGGNICSTNAQYSRPDGPFPLACQAGASGQSLAFDPAMAISVPIPSTWPYLSAGSGSHRLEFRLHGWNATVNGYSSVVQLPGLWVLLWNFNFLSVFDFADGAPTAAFVDLNGMEPDVLIRIQRDVERRRLTVEAWDTHGSTYQAGAPVPLATLSDESIAGQALTVGCESTFVSCGFQGNLAYLRWFSGALDLSAPPPANAGGGDLMDLELEGNLTDSSPNGLVPALLRGQASYVATP